MYRAKSNDEGCLYALAVVLIYVVVITAVYAGLALALIGAWNISLVPLFHIQPLQFWPAVGLLVVASIIGSFFKSNSSSK